MRSLFVVALAALGGTSCSNAGRHVPLGPIAHETGDVAGIVALDVGYGIGSLRIEPSSDAELSVGGEVHVRESRLEEFRGRLAFEEHVELRRRGDAIVIRNGHRDGDADDFALHLTVRVPGEVEVRANISVGSIAIALLAARRIDASSSVGSVDVRLTERQPPGGAVLGSDVGSVELRLPGAVAGQFALSTSVGGIDVAPRYGLAVQRGVTGASARGQVGVGGPEYRLTSSTGSVTLK